MPTMNFLDGEISTENGTATFSSDGIKAPLAAALPADLSGRKVTLGVRSEHVTLKSGEMSGVVRLVEPLGDASLVFFETGNARRLVAKVDPDLVFRPNENVTFRFEAENCHLFDAETGIRLN